MSRRLMALVVLGALGALGSGAHAQAPAETVSATDNTAHGDAPADMGDQAISAMLGAAGGGRSTPGGLLVAGHFYYQLSEMDWFDGSASFVFGSGAADCFRDRMNETVCDHGLADGYAAKLGFSVRRFMPTIASKDFWPFVRAGVGTSIVRFPDDAITGITFSLIGGAGLRASITEAVALTAGADLELGLGAFSNGLGAEPQLGVSISAGAEFKL
jgi:hypothetical protein